MQSKFLRHRSRDITSVTRCTYDASMKNLTQALSVVVASWLLKPQE
ncbi:hypothetical protein IQ243_17750 [Nostocales cyanobacterium LEGE 11386]|nr:hypothetical protein [Nostocales cyanobacterium LEGE 11386]